MTTERQRGDTTTACRVVVKGFVQGVGFRPYCIRLARRLRLCGRVYNSPEGVVVLLEGSEAAIERFTSELAARPPAMARIEELVVAPATLEGYRDFRSLGSHGSDPPLVRAPRDLPTCPACTAELFDRSNRRYRYPFITCTDCGPRYTILEALPYDRAATAMRHFPPCEHCAHEYADPDDRRYHSETNSCAVCGPHVYLLGGPGLSRRLAAGDLAVRRAVELIAAGAIVALKGLGGYQLLCLADDPRPVRTLRQRKNRPMKPFAVMVPSPQWLAERQLLSSTAIASLLTDPRNAIVLLPADDRWRNRTGIVPDVAPASAYLGLFLPTTPLHHLLLAELRRPLVATSGNVTEEPIVRDEDELDRLVGIADAALSHDRPVVHRADDSVLLARDPAPVTIRVGRGIGPLPLPTVERWLSRSGRCPPGLAVGGHQKVALALWTGQQAVLGLHIGDMDTAAARGAFEQAVHRLTELYACSPQWLAADLHPDYFTTRWAQARQLPVTLVQHHYAHALAAMADHDRLETLCLVATWDGTGYGADGTVWGGEVLLADVSGFERVASLWPFRLPGADAAVKEPWRVAVALLCAAHPDAPPTLLAGDAARVTAQPVARCRQLIEVTRRAINSPLTTSMGRLFDAVACVLLGVDTVSYEGEAAGALEAAARRAGGSTVKLSLPLTGHRPIRLDWRPLWRQLMKAVGAGTDRTQLAFAFHAAVADALGCCAVEIGREELLLSGGCFQNGLLIELVEEACRSRGIDVLAPGQIPPNDGGLAVGQLVHAAGRQNGRQRR